MDDGLISKTQRMEEKKDRPVGLIAGLVVSDVLLAAVGFLIYRKYK